MDDGGDYALYVRKGGHRHVIGEAISRTGSDNTEDAKANALLWASAGDLLEALEAAQKDLNDLSDFYVGHRDHNPSFAARVTLTRRKVHAALGKARGQS